MKISATLMATLVSGIVLAQEVATTAKPQGTTTPAARQLAYEALKADFLSLPLGKRLTTPLLWLHGEDHQILREHVDRIKDGGNGSFVIEPRPHPDWLGPKFWADFSAILDHAEKRGMGAYIYDEGKEWQSFNAGGKVPPQHKFKYLRSTAIEVTGPATYQGADHSGPTYIKTIAGRYDDGKNSLDAASLLDLGQSITHGNLSWKVPAGKWKVMKFSYDFQQDDPAFTKQLDLASQDAIDWFLDYVIKPHYEHARAGQILGSFYDEPFFAGTWGKGMENDSAHWKEMMVGQCYPLSGEAAHQAAYEYWSVLGERMARVGYGSYRDYLHAQGGKLIGHDNEHGPGCAPLGFGGGPINLMEKQKYQDMPGIDLVCDQFYPREEKYWMYQLPKLISSVAITNNLPGHYAMCEIFGAYAPGRLTWADRKWMGDWCQVHGVNVLIPHAFNPKGSVQNPDPDCPPFYYYTGDEANWPKYQSWCERQNRLSYMLSGNDDDNYSIAPVAMLWPGYSKYVDETWVDSNCYPYAFQTALDRAYHDHQLLTYDRFEKTASLNPTAKQIELYKSKYKVLVMPPVQHIPYATLAKAKQFHDDGGIVIGWQRPPSRSAQFGHSDREIQDLSVALWGSLTPSASVAPIRTNSNGGKTYFITATDEQTILGNLRRILRNAGIESDFKVVHGTWANSGEYEFDKWTGYTHRKRNGLDVFMVWNGSATAAALTLRLHAAGEPELWNPTTQAVTPLEFVRLASNQVELKLSLPAEESCLIVFKPAADADIHK
jgi:hypothetical protein